MGNDKIKFDELVKSLIEHVFDVWLLVFSAKYLLKYHFNTPPCGAKY